MQTRSRNNARTVEAANSGFLYCFEMQRKRQAARFCREVHRCRRSGTRRWKEKKKKKKRIARTGTGSRGSSHRVASERSRAAGRAHSAAASRRRRRAGKRETQAGKRPLLLEMTQALGSRGKETRRATRSMTVKWREQHPTPIVIRIRILTKLINLFWRITEYSTISPSNILDI
jgi:hypothetical protein